MTTGAVSVPKRADGHGTIVTVSAETAAMRTSEPNRSSAPNGMPVPSASRAIGRDWAGTVISDRHVEPGVHLRVVLAAAAAVAPEVVVAGFRGGGQRDGFATLRRQLVVD